MIPGIIRPLSPKFPGWNDGVDVSMRLRSPFTVIWYEHSKERLRVFSAVEVARDKDGIDRGPEYHISISKFDPLTGRPGMCSADEAKWVLEQFGCDGAEEDNHVPGGVVRNFWRPVADSLVGLECACKDTENVEIVGDFVRRPLP